MSLFRAVLLVSLLSLLAALGLHFAGAVFSDNSTVSSYEFQEGYAVLTTNASVDDRALRSLLEAGEEFFRGEPVSESSQWVMLDVFDSLEKIPLDRYYSRVFPFDPRNDGYAGKLKELFIKDGKRIVYIPLKEGYSNSNLLDLQLKDMLSDIPFSVEYFTEYFSVGRPLNLFFMAYGAASLCLLVICFLTRKQNRKIAGIIALIPALSSLAWIGAPGIACAALLFAMFILLKEPLYELVMNSSSNGFFKEIIFPYRFYWLFLPLFAAAISIIVIFSQLKLFFLLVVFAAATALFLFSMRIISVSQRNRRRFTPVMIMRRRFPELNFSLYMLPFAIASFFVLFFDGSFAADAPVIPVAFNHDRQFKTFIDEQDYYEHLNHQAFFSTRQMSPRSGLSGYSSDVFPGFFFDTDGLPSMENNIEAGQTVNIDDFPPFPLKPLMDFFNNVNSRERTTPGSGGGNMAGRLSLLVLLLFLLPLFFVKREKTPSLKINFGNFKRIPAKTRLKGINWFNKPLYNDRNQLLKRKDA